MFHAFDVVPFCIFSCFSFKKFYWSFNGDSQIHITDLREAHERQYGVVKKEDIVNGFVHVPDENAVSRVWGGDRRLSLFSYSIETINLLLIPMIKTK